MEDIFFKKKDVGVFMPNEQSLCPYNGDVITSFFLKRGQYKLQFRMQNHWKLLFFPVLGFL